MKGFHRLIGEIEARQKELENFILATPTGEIRNQMTDANIHLMAALDAMKSVGAKVNGN